MSSISGDLCNRRFAVWNIEYRRIGEPLVGWDEISSDVLAALEFLQDFSERERRLDMSQVALVGHSAGGQLALACMSTQAQLQLPRTRKLRFKPVAVVALAAITDLEEAFASNAGNGAVRSLLGGSPAEYQDRFAGASPIRLLPHGSRQLLLHGTEDEDVPLSPSRAYAWAAALAGDEVSCFELEGTDHTDFLDPRSSAHHTLCEWLQGLRRVEF